MVDFRQLIIDDMKPALGVTEPAAIALACAKARALSNEPVERVVVRVNSGIYKNAFTCGIPGTIEVGNEYAAALGIVCGDAEKGLCVLEDVNDFAVATAKEIIKAGKIKVEIDSISSELFIGATVHTEHDVCTVQIRGSHTNFCLIEKNGHKLLEKAYEHSESNRSPIVNSKIADIYSFALSAPIKDLEFMLDAYRVNGGLAEAGAKWERCTITRNMLTQNSGRFISDDPRMSAKTYACAAAEARVLGIDKAAMSITGSGTHGIIYTLPLAAYCKAVGLSEEKLLRATAISYLVCMYIKEFSGKLSAFCGCGIAGGTGLSCALAYLMGGDEESLVRCCNNMAASITGMICTGGNHCCCLKVITAVDCAYNAAVLSVGNSAVYAPHGLCDDSVEKTLQNIGLIADPGMVDTERVIVEIMKSK